MNSGQMTPLQITSYTLTTALGAGTEANWQSLMSRQSALEPCSFDGITDMPAHVGQIKSLDDAALKNQWSRYDCRNNRLAWLALQPDCFIDNVNQAIKKYGSHRVGLFIGTSTSGIHKTEQAYASVDPSTDRLPDWYDYEMTHNVYSVVNFVSRYLGLTGIAASISTACSSSAKVFASAQRAIINGLCDAAIVGGVDTLCATTLYGFNSLQLVAPQACQPSDKNRCGISIGEAGGFALLEPPQESDSPRLLGYGESSDAYHMSSPHPEGRGALQAMKSALYKARLTPQEIQYINLHGTGTVANDAAEAKAICKLFGSTLPCSSTKGWMGHTLGAAGMVEAAISLLCIQYQMIPGTLNTKEIDPDIKACIVLDNQFRQVENVISNSFGFGGSNCSLIFGTP